MNFKKLAFIAFSSFVLFSCSKEDETITTTTEISTPVSAFDEFNPDAVTISFDGDQITIETNGQPNHTSPYWEETHPLHIDPVVALAQTPGRIGNRSLTVTVSAAPEIASSSTATGLGPIGISVTGVPIFNDTEGDNRPIEEQIVETFDYAGAHNGPSGYHYHIESYDVPENNTVLSHNDEKLVGIMADGFLIYGRKCNSTGNYPTDLDVSGAHTSSTQHSDGKEFYHYHIINEFYLGSIIALFAVDLQGTPNSIL
ncbi:YHYH protein [uncultured Polaribacter sp.]|uniref:YHYH protein n=1 Tax=uncultured Polaribacter sp. TaxID=174711 RepID=UPI0026016973|nr:YHYH protein [uncultured Polaribacter sp.]